jgi:fructose-1,6-bisphosphatase I
MKLAVGAVVFVTGTVSAFVSPNPSFRSRTSLFSTATESPARGETKIPVFDEVCDTTGVTLTRFLTEIDLLNPELRELTSLFGAIDTACKAISNLVKRSQLPNSETLGYEGNVNVQGEDQKVACVLAKSCSSLRTC